MPFNSYGFIFIFLPLTLTGFHLLYRLGGRTAALGGLTLASVVFYGYAGLGNILLVLPWVFLNYLIATASIDLRLSRPLVRQALFVGGVSINVLVLGYFKYRNFFADTVNQLAGTHFQWVTLILPLGVSFMTFQNIGFLADVYARRIEAVRLPDFLLFTLFFPRAAAGPIVRYTEFVPQLVNTSRGSANDVCVAICLFSVGLFKKSIVADGIAQYVPGTFDNPLSLSSLTLLTAWTGVLSYTFELYFDFSGYSDMALGVARLFGLKLPMNFNSPYKSCSIIEFWSRWHISLTRFLTAYVYTPIVLHLARARMLVGKPVLSGRRSALSAVLVLVGCPTLITMTVSGLWHGAGWQFVVWGILHGLYLTINQTWRLFRTRFWRHSPSYHRVMRPLGVMLTFGAVVVAFVFFRASSVSDGMSILRAMAGSNGLFPHDVQMYRHLGVEIGWTMMTGYWQPVAPVIWIVTLLVSVMVLPNTLELLQRYQPAVDFPDALDAQSSASSGAVAGEHREVSERARIWPGWVGHTWKAAGEIGRSGILLSRATATAAAFLFVLALTALNHGTRFLYWKF